MAAATPDEVDGSGHGGNVCGIRREGRGDEMRCVRQIVFFCPWSVFLYSAHACMCRSLCTRHGRAQNCEAIFDRLWAVIQSGHVPSMLACSQGIFRL